MRSRYNELVERSIQAMVSAVEIYNKPNFQYRGETFAILAINSWELLFKAKWLNINDNRVNSLYVYEYKKTKNGVKSKKKTIKTTRSGNPFTHSLDYIAKQIIDKGLFDKDAFSNLELLIELRDSAIHFYHYSETFSLRLQEIGTATLRNYIHILKEWFDRDLSNFNFYLMPLSFIACEKDPDLLILNSEEKNFFNYIEQLESKKTDPTESDFAITLNVDIKFTKSKTRDAVHVAISDDPEALKVTLTEEQIREKYPLTYNELLKICKDRYKNCIINSRFHDIKSQCLEDTRYAITRFLDPKNPKSTQRVFFSNAIFNVFDKHYLKVQN